MEKQIFSDKLRSLMYPHETQQQFGDRIGINRNTIAQYLSKKNEKPASVDVIKQICEKCNVSADWLLGLSDVKEPDEDIKAVCAYTWPLSEKAVQYLHPNDEEGHDEIKYQIIKTASMLLETEEGHDLLDMLFRYWNADFSGKNKDISVHARNKDDNLYYSIPFKALQFACLEQIKEIISEIRNRIENNEITFGGENDAKP